MRLGLRHVRGSRNGTEELFDQACIRIGRRPDNDVALHPVDDASASGYHCELFCEAGQFHVRDLGSQNGTFVNGEQVRSPTPLRTGDRLELGREGPAFEVRVGEEIGGTARLSRDSVDAAREEAAELKAALTRTAPERAAPRRLPGRWLAWALGGLALLLGLAVLWRVLR